MGAILLVAFISIVYSLRSDRNKSEALLGFSADEMLASAEAVTLTSARVRAINHQLKNQDSFAKASGETDRELWEWQVLPYDREQIDWGPITKRTQTSLVLYERRMAVCTNQIGLILHNLSRARELGYQGEMDDVREEARKRIGLWFRYWRAIALEGPVANPTLFEWEQVSR